MQRCFARALLEHADHQNIYSAPDAPSDTLGFNVVVTGGSGFIGTHVAERLGTANNVSIIDTREPSENRFNFIKGTVLNPDEMTRAMEDCDVVVHLAGVVGVERTESNPISTLDVNIQGTRNILEACRANGVAKIIFASSSEIYGQAFRLPVKESVQPKPISAYGLSKLVGEEYIRSFSALYGMRYTILRLFNVYGPGQSSDFVIPRFVSSALRGEPITIHGDGTQIRSFCHVRDVSNSVLLATDKGDDQILNIGNDRQPVTINELAETIVSIAHSKSSLVHTPIWHSGRKRQREVFRRIPDIAKASRILGYVPDVSLGEGLTELVQLQRRRA